LYAYCTDVGIRRGKSVAECPPSNGWAERVNRTLTERLRGMLWSLNVPKYSGDACATATLIYNLCPRSGQKVNSFELFHGRKPDVSNLRVFGCTVYSLMHSKDRKKPDARSERGRLIGYEDGTKGWKILLDDGRIEVRRHCYSMNLGLCTRIVGSFPMTAVTRIMMMVMRRQTVSLIRQIQRVREMTRIARELHLSH
jgi:hypothetical protein